MFQTTHLQEKWQPVLDHPDLPKINDAYRRAVTTVILENQEKALREFLSQDKAMQEMILITKICSAHVAPDVRRKRGGSYKSKKLNNDTKHDAYVTAHQNGKVLLL